MAVTNEIQTITVTATGGTWTLGPFRGDFYATGLAYNITASALQATAGWDPDILVSGGPAGTAPLTLTFTGKFAGVDQALLIGDGTNLTGTGHGVTVVETRKGGQILGDPPTFRAAWSRGWTQSTSLPTTLPTDVQDGDRLVLAVVLDHDVSVSGATGWSSKFVDFVGVTCLQVLTARYDPTGANGVSTAPTLTWGGSSYWNLGYLGAWSDAAFVDVVGHAVGSTASTSPSTSVTTTSDNDTLIWMAASNSGSGAVTLPAGFAARFTSTGGFGIGDKAQAAAGATGALTGSISSSQWLAAVITLAPVTVAPAALTGFWGIRGRTVAGGGGGGSPPAGATYWKADATATGSTNAPIDQEWAEISSAGQSTSDHTCRTNSGSLVWPDSRFTVSTFAPAGLGKSYRVEHRMSDPSVYGPRTEVGQGNPVRLDWDGSADDGSSKPTSLNPHMFYSGDHYWIGVQIYLDGTTFPTDPPGMCILQFKHISDGNGGPMVLELGDRGDGQGFKWTWSASGSADYTDDSKQWVPGSRLGVTRGVWTRWLFEILFSNDNAVGYYQVLADVAGSGTLATMVPKTFDYTMCKDFSSGIILPSHSRMGLYRNPTDTGTAVAYYAGYNVATTKELAAYNAGITLP